MKWYSVQYVMPLILKPEISRESFFYFFFTTKGLGLKYFARQLIVIKK